MAGRAVVLLSGGLDSATVLARARADGWSCCALSFDYGQRHTVELGAARSIAEVLGAQRHLVVPVGLDVIGGSALTDDIAVPKHPPGDAVDPEGGIPVTYVPARNTVFLSLALGWAEVLGVHDIFIGVNAIDYSGYPDCRPEFIEAFEHLANLATAAGVEGRSGFRIRTPLIAMSKAEIIAEGTALGVDYSRTVSCYDPDPDAAACGHCDACLLRRQGFADAGLDDPTRYAGPLGR
ncbi:MAG: 7-cyano-7-deazaguanine synthase QueC [Microthrixaceae bacterium]